MELFLNLLWASFVAIAGVCLARKRSPQSSVRRPLVAVATVCVLALLFPIISVTDDLNSDVAMPEETNGIRRTTQSVAHHVDSSNAAAAVLPLAAMQSIALSVMGAPATESPLRPRSVTRLAAAARPPPFCN